MGKTMPEPEMQYVDSSNVEAIGWDAESQELHVLFLGGGLYVYQEVPDYIFEGLMNAQSKGSYLHREIKGRFQYEKR